MDVRFAFRSFTKNPGFTAVVLLTLALGIGGSTSIFSVVNGVLLRPLPYPDPDRLVSVQSGGQGSGDPAHAPGDYLNLQREQRSFSAITAHRGDVIDITSERAEPLRLDGALVTNTFFDVFGVPAARGRTFTGADRPGGDRLLVISDGAWRQRFGGAPDVAGRTVRVNGQPVVGEGMRLVAAGTVVGVIAAVAAGRVVAALLFGVEATDPATYAAVIAVLALVAFAACYLPALRAARVNPMSALRSE